MPLEGLEQLAARTRQAAAEDHRVGVEHDRCGRDALGEAGDQLLDDRPRRAVALRGRAEDDLCVYGRRVPARELEQVAKFYRYSPADENFVAARTIFAVQVIVSSTTGRR